MPPRLSGAQSSTRRGRDVRSGNDSVDPQIGKRVREMGGVRCTFIFNQNRDCSLSGFIRRMGNGKPNRIATVQRKPQIVFIGSMVPVANRIDFAASAANEIASRPFLSEGAEKQVQPGKIGTTGLAGRLAMNCS